MFYENLEAINMRYYSQDSVVVRDSNRTPWLFVIKSVCFIGNVSVQPFEIMTFLTAQGYVKVVRKQCVFNSINKESKNSKRQNSQSHARGTRTEN